MWNIRATPSESIGIALVLHYHSWEWWVLRWAEQLYDYYTVYDITYRGYHAQTASLPGDSLNSSWERQQQKTDVNAIDFLPLLFVPMTTDRLHEFPEGMIVYQTKSSGKWPPRDKHTGETDKAIISQAGIRLWQEHCSFSPVFISLSALIRYRTNAFHIG